MKGSYPEFETKMEKSIGFMKEEFAAIRAGRANAAVLDKVMVEYYGTPTPFERNRKSYLNKRNRNYSGK